jgi:hypothetical protein
MLPCLLYPRLHRCPVAAQPHPSDQIDLLHRALWLLASILWRICMHEHSHIIKHLHTRHCIETSAKEAISFDPASRGHASEPGLQSPAPRKINV